MTAYRDLIETNPSTFDPNWETVVALIEHDGDLKALQAVLWEALKEAFLDWSNGPRSEPLLQNEAYARAFCRHYESNRLKTLYP